MLGWLVLPGSPLRWTIAAILLMFSPGMVPVRVFDATGRLEAQSRDGPGRL